MSVVVLQTPCQLDKYCNPEPEQQIFQTKEEAVVAMEDEEDRPGQVDIWSAIQASKVANPLAADSPAPPYVHPLVRRSSSSMSQKSLQVCTESLGSETGSDDFSAFLDDLDVVDYLRDIETTEKDQEHNLQDQLAVVGDEGEMPPEKETEERDDVLDRGKGKEIASVNYHCSISKRSPPRSFPPPLLSISCRNAPYLQMKPRRHDGRLVLEAVPAPSQNYLHAQREGGRLLLSFIDATFNDASSDGAASDQTIKIEQPQEEHQPTDKENGAVEIARLVEEEEEAEEVEDEEDDEEEEVEVVDRGTVVEVKVSTQPQQQSGGAMKVLRSSLVINKFVGGTPMSSKPHRDLPRQKEASTNQLRTIASRRPTPTTATAAAAAVVATAEAYNEHSSNGEGARLLPDGDDGLHPPPDNKLLFTSKRRNREELLHSMRRCSQLRRTLFIWEPYCIATS
ncbi:hypothetical protein Cni_G21258 [Canna indica]|uniref:FAF domain-containing protein n=1 Tax=Canna indica TaxID=4628 RepID=A0AAQ3KUK7_9LILI|nr:hypothetical protein Cni_G21258 [Canna indica]